MTLPPQTLDDRTPPQGLRAQARVLRRYAPFYLPEWPRIILLLVIMPAVTAVVRALIPVLTILLVDEALPRGQYRGVVFIVTLILVVAVAIQGIYLLESALRYLVKVQVLRRLGERFYRHMLRMSLRFHATRPVGERVFRGFVDVHDASHMLGVSLPLAVSMALQGLLAAAATAIIDPRAVIVMLVFSPPYFLLVRYVTAKWRQTDREMRERRQSVMAQLQQSLANILLVKAAAREAREAHRYGERLFAYLRSFYRWFVHSAFQEAVVHPAGAAVFFAMLTSAIWGYWHIVGLISLGQWFALQELVLTALIALAQVGLQYQTLGRDMVAAERILDVLDIPPDLCEPSDALRLSRLKGDIACREVTFAYEGSEPVLRSVSMEARAGERIAVVGFSGSGKSTLLSLLLRFRDPDTGSIVVDGHDVRRLHLDSCRRRIGVVLQNPQLFSGTVRENLTYGCSAILEERLEASLEAADCLDFVKQMPQGLDTMMGEGGDLSGGQKQRLTIARALARDPDVLLFDEPFISLDVESASRIASRLLGPQRGPTMIFFTHSPASVRGVDRYYVLENGAVKEVGTYGELMARRGVFCELVQAQEGVMNSIDGGSDLLDQERTLSDGREA